jgi:Mg-chelatase subunit ChlD
MKQIISLISALFFLATGYWLVPTNHHFLATGYCLLPTNIAFAVDKASRPPVQTQQTKNGVPEKSNEGYDIVILMDCSGSMKKTDPQNYRKPAARLFISLLGEYDRIGIIGFGDSAKVLAHLTENTKKNREGLFGAINKITSKEFSTNITDAVKKGFEELKASNRKNRILILMSDGKLALGSKEKDEAAFKELSGFLPEIAKSGIRLYSIAFTEMSDIKLLEEMAKTTGGFFRLAKADKDLHVIFSSIFEKIKSPDTIPLEDDTFNIDKDIDEAILLISKQPGTSTTLIDPTKGKHTPAKYGKNIQWYETKAFDMITIKKPATGKWKVKLSTKEGNKVFVITNLNLKSSFDKGFVNKGDKVTIDAWLEKEGGAISEKEVLEHISFSATVSSPDGQTTKIDLAQSNGKYIGEFIVNIVGEYSVKIAADSKTFKREKVLQFKAVEPPPQKVEKKALVKKDETKKADWNSVIIKFGIINLSLLVVVGIVLLARKIIIKSKTKAKKKGNKK